MAARGPRQRKGLTADQKMLLWKAADSLAVAWEPAFAEAAARAFEHDKRELMAIVAGAKARKATVAWEQVMIPVLDYVRMASPDNWRREFVPVMEGLIVAQGEQLNAQFGMQFDVRNILGEKAFEDYVIKFADEIARTTNDDITALLQTAMREGWAIPKMQRALGELFDRYMNDAALPEEARDWFADRLPAYRRENIARTETIRASNLGSYELFKGWGVTRKEWLSTLDNRVRPEHAAANGQVVGIDESFNVGGESMLYPGDPNGSAAMVCNCRCVVLPVL